MSFLWPIMLLSLVSIPVLIGWYVRRRRRRMVVAIRYGSLGMLQNVTGRKLGIRRHIPSLIFLLALIILIFGSARPVTMVRLPRLESTVILAFDVSGSMAADDLKPTRLDAAKAAATAFIQRQPTTVQIGVVAFSDSGFSTQAPTNDQGALLRAIARLSPQRGSSLAGGISAAITIIALDSGQTHYYSNPASPGSSSAAPTATPTAVPSGTYVPAAIVLLTDGENNLAPDPLIAAQAAAARGIRIYTIGVGTAAGADVHISGFSIHTQLDEATLQQIAQITGGTYYNADTEQDLRQIYDNLNMQIDTKPQTIEVTSIFAGVGILVMLIGSAFSMLWFSRVP